MKKYYQLYIARNEAGHSTEDAANLLGISKGGYWQKESGYSEFKLSEAFILAEIYGISVNDLFPETLSIFRKELEAVK